MIGNILLLLASLLIIGARITYVQSDEQYVAACLKCDSNDNITCAVNAESLVATPCSNTTSACYVMIEGQKNIRGCVSELTNATICNPTNCEICNNTIGCNKYDFPKNRVQCLQCIGNSTDKCGANTDLKPMTCPLYKQDDMCFILKARNGTDYFRRGCLSSVPENDIACGKGRKNCYTCNGIGCNSKSVNSTDIPVYSKAADVIQLCYTLIPVIIAIAITNN